MGISLILATDGITAPLSGIGRYALELASGLTARPQIDSLRCFSFGCWVKVPVRAELEKSGEPARGRLRAALAGSRAAVRIYHGSMPYLSGWRLRGEGGALFHSPNYLLPPFPGASVATVHDLSHVVYPQFHPSARVDYMNLAFPQTLRRATHLITDAESVRQELIQRVGWSADRVTAVPLGVDAAFQPHDAAELQPLMRRLGLRSNEYSLCVGTIEPRKNIDRLLSAYEALPATLRRDFPLVLAGAQGWRSAEIHARIARAESAGWLRYLAFVPEDELPMLYAGARLFVYPSLYEGFGLPVLEAMASGAPVITSNVASLPEVVGAAAWLVDPKDADQIAEALQELLQNEERRCIASAAGLARSASFTWAECVTRTIGVYQKVMDDASSA
jgi:glycosyltransferase involved in cell wall biosynthesis